GHFQEGRDFEKAARYAVAAAEQAAGALAFDSAARLYRIALELRSADDPEVRILRVKLAEALANAGRGAEAARAYLAAAEGLNDAEVLKLERIAAEQFLRSGHIDEGLAVLRTVLKRIGMRMAD